MTKLKVNVLIVLMAISLLGIVVLQVLWMKNAIQVRNELFDRSVNEALVRTSSKLQRLDDVDDVSKMMHGTHSRGENRSWGHRPMHDSSNRSFNKMVKDAVSSDQNDSLSVDLQVNHFGVVLVDSVVSDLENKIDKNIELLYNQSVKTLSADSNRTTNRVELIRRFGNKAQRLKSVAGKMVYESWQMDDNERLDTMLINKILFRELLKLNIPISYQMGVLSGKKPIIKVDQADSVLLLNTKYTTNLFTNTIFDRHEKIAVYFPDRKAFILSELVLPLLLSLLFCFFIFLVFGLSIYYILSQKKLSEMKSDFINNMTHEFKTPLATIAVAADAIVNKKVIGDREKVNYFIQMIKKENLRMNQQVETILQIASMDKSDYQFDFGVVDLHELIDQAVQRMVLQLESRGGTITVLKHADNSMVTSDATHVLNLLNNLLDNANKYSPDHPQIIIETTNSSLGVWIKIADKGVGMTKQAIQKIFEQFYRVSSGNIHNVKGFGLGLSYVKTVIDAHKGDVKVYSEPGKGSSFEVFLPFSLD